MTSRRRGSGLYLAGRTLEDLSALSRGPGPFARRIARRSAWSRIWRAGRRAARSR